jgi:hypothetical protein
MRYFRWDPYSGADEEESESVWSLSIDSIELNNILVWDLRLGKYIEVWDTNTTAYYDKEVEYSDYPFATGLLPVYSTRLKSLMEDLGIKGIQYLPLRIRRRDGAKEVDGYYIANYLIVIDCLDRERSVYQVWTKDNLLFWEKRPYMLGTFRDVTKAVIDSTKLSDAPIFRLWGWEIMVVVREDVKQAIEEAGITGCVFREIEVV